MFQLNQLVVTDKGALIATRCKRLGFDMYCIKHIQLDGKTVEITTLLDEKLIVTRLNKEVKNHG